MEIFVAITPGLEPALAEEVSALADRPVQTVPGGVSFEGDLEDAAGLVLWSRTAAHVRVRLGVIKARSPQELLANARGLDWKKFVHPGQRVEVSATLKNAKWKRPDVAAGKVAQAAAAALKGPRLSHRRPPPPQLVQVRIVGGEATISLDAGGGMLHKRGYRLATAKAPIRENLGAALLLAAGWIPGAPLADPMCGAGTFSIEAALMARDLAPNRDREPPVVSWPCFPQKVWPALQREVRRQRPAVPTRILTSDRDPGAVRATRENARRAGVLGDLQLTQSDLTAPADPVGGPPGLVILNPPYGVRVADKQKLHSLYRKLGRGILERYPGWRLAALSTDRALAGRLLPRMDEVLTFRNGGIPLALYVGELST